MAEQFDELLCLPHLRGVERLDYQVETVLKVLRVLGGRALLADEVGLGKTIETGMLIKEMLLRSTARRVLVLTPSALVGQWAEELAAKFGVEARTTDDRAMRRGDPAAWQLDGVVVASLHWAKRGSHADVVAAVPWDLVAVDEAHHVKNRKTTRPGARGASGAARPSQDSQHPGERALNPLEQGDTALASSEIATGDHRVER
jgi:SNF2 family DNA or RNA helicase